MMSLKNTARTEYREALYMPLCILSLMCFSHNTPLHDVCHTMAISTLSLMLWLWCNTPLHDVSHTMAISTPVSYTHLTLPTMAVV